jgi:hypothetical protein
VNVVASTTRVVRRGGQLAFSSGLAFRRLEEPFEKWAAPAATGPRAKALGQLPDATRLLDANEVFHFPSRNVKTEAKFVVGFHTKILQNALRSLSADDAEKRR